MTGVVSKERSRNYLRQVKSGVVYRVVAVAGSFLAIPLMIKYLGQEQFGVWATLLTVMTWIVFFDIGVGNGLRNKVAESLAKGETNEAAGYIASGYTLIGMIALAMWGVTTAGSYIVPWQTVFNTEAIPEHVLGKTIRIAAFFIVLNFWIGLIGALLGAFQRTSMISLGQMLSNLLILVLVFLLVKTTEASVSNLALIYGISLVTGNVVLSLWFYKGRPELLPRVYLDKRHMRPMLTVGLQFFTIQLAVLIIFTTDKMLITQLFGPECVTQYEVVFKLFSVITLVHGLISMPLWSAYTDAYHREDFAWIGRMLRKQLIIFAGFVVTICLLALLAQSIIRIWIGQELFVSRQLIGAMSLFVLLATWNNIYAMLVNGIGKIKLQLYTAIVAMFVNIPLSILFAKYLGLGVSGIVVGTICSLLFAAVALPLQVHRLIRPAARCQVA